MTLETIDTWILFVLSFVVIVVIFSFSNAVNQFTSFNCRIKAILYLVIESSLLATVILLVIFLVSWTNVWSLLFPYPDRVLLSWI